ncbi:lytic transglycosylase domain-containing protein [Pinisolibacter sp. B13]|nr:lytic transglycosylase domain-containing protein [Pinisolibacter aquiterrae]
MRHGSSSTDIPDRRRLPTVESACRVGAGAAGAVLRSAVVMASLQITSICLPAVAAAQAADRPITTSSATDPLAGAIRDAAQRFEIPAVWIRAVIEVASGGDARATSPQGAIGLMQIPPETWAELRARYHLGNDPYPPDDNIMAGAALLRELFDRYGAEGFLAAYFAGPRRYDDHLRTGRPLPPEVQIRVAHLLPLIGTVSTDAATTNRSVEPTWTTAPLFIGRVVIGPSADWEPAEDRSAERPAVGSVVAEPSGGRRSSATETRASLFVSRTPAGPGR